MPRSRNDSNGSFSLYLPMLIFMANSQYTAGLISLVFATSSIRLRAVELSCASPSTNQRKVCVSRSIFIACTRQNISSAHRLRPELPGSLRRNQIAAATPQAKVAARQRLIVTGNDYFLAWRQTCDQFGQMGLRLFNGNRLIHSSFSLSRLFSAFRVSNRVLTSCRA